MTRLEYLSQISNAVLSPELNKPDSLDLKKYKAERTAGVTSKDEYEYTRDWCKEQKRAVGEFGAVLGGGV